MKHPHNHNTHHMSSPRKKRQRCPWPAPPRWIPTSLKGKYQENTRRGGQHTVLRSYCRLHLPGRSQLHCDTTDKHNRQHPENNRKFVRLSGDISRRKNTVQRIRNDSPNPHGCIILIRTKGSKSSLRPPFFWDGFHRTTNPYAWTAPFTHSAQS